MSYRPRPYEHFDVHYRVKGVKGFDPCVYCGVISDTYDHIPPLAYVASLSDTDAQVERLRKYPACVECNGWLGARPLLTLAERRKFIRDKLRKKYRKVLSMPVWSQEELDELGPTMADDIRRITEFQKHVRARLYNASN